MANNESIDALYSYDLEHVELLQNEKPWKKSPKFFKEAKISALASMKMLTHALSGVAEGQSSPGGKPLEIMGFMIGKPVGDTIVVLDACPLPIKGCETNVVADDIDTTNYLINLSENLELTRPERFVGWYHSHPFDVGSHSHCFLSSTDVQTQYLWQVSNDPWIAVDPLRSLAKGEPEFGAFHVYPLDFKPQKGMTPDGEIVDDEEIAKLRWGNSFQRFYSLQITSFTSTFSQHLFQIMARKHLWIKVLCSNPTQEEENRKQFSDRINNIAMDLSYFDNLSSQGHGPSKSLSKLSEKGVFLSPLAKSSQVSAELAIEHCQGQANQVNMNEF